MRCHLNAQIYAMKVVDKASIERHRSMDNIAIELQVLRQHAEVRRPPPSHPRALRHATPPHLSPSTHPPPPLQVRHPFILGLECAFQSASKLHFVTEYVPGGMLFNHLRKQEMFSEKMVRLYALSNTDPIPRPPLLPQPRSPPRVRHRRRRRRQRSRRAV